MEQPIACTLTPSGYAARRQQTAGIAREFLRSRQRIARGARLTFAAGDGPERALREIIAAEAECCPFLRFDLARAGESLRLDVTGPDEAQPIIEQLFG